MYHIGVVGRRMLKIDTFYYEVYLRRKGNSEIHTGKICMWIKVGIYIDDSIDVSVKMLRV